MSIIFGLSLSTTITPVHASDFVVGDQFKLHGKLWKVKIRRDWYILRKSGDGGKSWNDAGKCKAWGITPAGTAVMAGHLAALANDKNACNNK